MPESDFQATRWSLIERADATNPDLRRKALGEFFEIYWKPLYWFARRSGRGPEDAADSVQGFCISLQEKEWLGRADPNLGKLRTFLLALFKSHLGDERRRAAAKKRGGDRKIHSIDSELGERLLAESANESVSDLDTGFDREWARTIFDHVLKTLRSEMKPETYEAVHPILTGDADTRIAKAAESAGMSEGAMRVTLHRARKRVRELLRAEVRDSLLPDDDLEEEIRYLAGILPE